MSNAEKGGAVAVGGRVTDEEARAQKAGVEDANRIPAGLAALCLLARLHRIAAEPAAVMHQLGRTSSEPWSTDDLLLAARHLGLKGKLSRPSVERLSLTPLPALALLRDGRTVVLAQCDGQRVLLQDPSEQIQGGRPVIEPIAVFTEQWTGELLLVTSRASVAGELAKFDFSWFIPSLVKYRKLFGEVLVISLFLQLFALISPLFFQVVMDKVLVHNGLTTLDVLVIGLLVVVVFESVLTALRTYVVGTGDTVTESASAGTDTVQSSITWTLGSNLEKLVLTGTSAINGTGNTVANVLTGNSAANTLNGSSGADTLIGGAGNDSYVLGRGYGADTVQENDTTAGNTDVLQFLSGVSTEQIWLRKVSNNLEISIIGTSDKATLTNWYLGNQYHVEQFKTSDGKTLLDSQVQNLVSAMAGFTPPAAGQTTLPPSYQTALAPVIAANWNG
ncbi:MAG: cysteine peptidase family C39 domain-containing protein [Methylibium sp.]|nr:cysteine peptidase family C39 domain-containing protein [Methylibium sp.]